MKAAVVESVIDIRMKNADLFVLMDIINLRGIADGFVGNNSGYIVEDIAGETGRGAAEVGFDL